MLRQGSGERPYTGAAFGRLSKLVRLVRLAITNILLVLPALGMAVGLVFIVRRAPIRPLILNLAFLGGFLRTPILILITFLVSVIRECSSLPGHRRRHRVAACGSHNSWGFYKV